MKLPWRGLYQTALLSGLYLPAFGAPAFAAESVYCRGDVVDVAGIVEPGNRTGLLIDVKGRKYLIANLYFVPSSAFSVKQTIAGFINQTNPEFVAGRAGPDRYGRLPVHVYSGNGTERRWLQKELVDAGLAIVRPGNAENDCIDALLQAETRSRLDKNGVWQNPEKLMMTATANDWSEMVDAYRIVEGRVLSVGEAGSRIYLNFGTNWQRDFTVIVAKRHAKRFKGMIGNLKELAGRKIRVRGWMVSDRGPMIEVYYSGQIELDVD